MSTVQQNTQPASRGDAMELSRRNVLSGLGILAAASAAGHCLTARARLALGEPRPRHDQLVAQAPSGAGPSAGLTLVLQFGDGSSRTFSQAAARAAGDYVGHFVHQQCFVARSDEWTIFFRPDADRSRDEIVVERGTMWLSASEKPVHILEPYTATILKDGKRIAQVTVPRHWWWTRWRWQSSARPVRRSLSDLISMKALCPLGKATLYGAGALRTIIKWRGPMDTGGLEIGMGTAGERPEIGPITEYQAGYLLHGNAEALTTMMTQAEAVGSMPIWARDERTGALVDVYQMPGIAFRAGTPTIREPSYPYNRDGGYNDYLFRMDVAHIPSPAYVPWLLTDDPYFYEGVEAIGSYGVLATSYHRAYQKLPGLVYPGETRAWAWGIREPMRLAAFAPSDPPSWLKPRTCWQSIVQDNLKFTRQYMSSPAKIHRVFRQFTRSDTCTPFMSAYVMSSLGWAVWSGFYPEWSEFTRWFGEGLLAFVDGASGWDRRWPAPYWLNLLTMREMESGRDLPAMLAILDESWDSTTPDSWGEAWRLFPKWLETRAAGSFSTPRALDPRRWTDPDKVYENADDSPYGIVKGAPSGPGYSLYLRGALAFAELAGVPNAKAAHDWLHSKLPAVCASYGATGFRKWSFQIA
jgi:hypothetical protein